MFKSDRPLTATINLCVFFQTKGKPGFGAERLFSIQADKKRQRRQVQLVFMSCGQSLRPPVCLQVQSSGLLAVYPFCLYKGYCAGIHRQHTQATFNETGLKHTVNTV